MNDQTDQKRRELARRVLDRIASDPQFREQLVENPQQALETSGFAREIREWQGSGDVSGYAMAPGAGTGTGAGYLGPPVHTGLDSLLGLSAPAPLTSPPSYEAEPTPGALPGVKPPDPVTDPSEK